LHLLSSKNPNALSDRMVALVSIFETGTAWQTTPVRASNEVHTAAHNT
jgi:hypothetical protein